MAVHLSTKGLKLDLYNILVSNAFNVDLNFVFRVRETLMESVRSFKPASETVTEARVLLVGPVGAGKSSFISSVQSVFSGRVINRAMVGSSSSTSFTKKVNGTRTCKSFVIKLNLRLTISISGRFHWHFAFIFWRVQAIFRVYLWEVVIRFLLFSLVFLSFALTTSEEQERKQTSPQLWSCVTWWV